MKAKQHELVIDDNLTLVSTDETKSNGTFNTFIDGKCVLCKLTGKSITSVSAKKPIVRDAETVRLASEWLADIMRPSAGDVYDPVTALLNGDFDIEAEDQCETAEPFSDPAETTEEQDEPDDWTAEFDVECEFSDARRTYNDLMADAADGDAEALEKLPGAAEAYQNAAKQSADVSASPTPETDAGDMIEQAKVIFSAAIDGLAVQPAQEVIARLISALIAINHSPVNSNHYVSSGSRRDQVKSIIASADHALSVADIAKATDMNYSYSFRIVKDLLTEGLIVREGPKKYRIA